jgi:hypothetical protein
MSVSIMTYTVSTEEGREVMRNRNPSVNVILFIVRGNRSVTTSAVSMFLLILSHTVTLIGKGVAVFFVSFSSPNPWARALRCWRRQSKKGITKHMALTEIIKNQNSIFRANGMRFVKLETESIAI